MRWIPLLLCGCAVIGSEAHRERVDALSTPTDAPTLPVPTDTADTDVPTPTDSAPQLTSVTTRFRFNELGFYRGLQLLVHVTDDDGDLTGGELQIQGGEAVPWSEAVALEDDQWLVPVELELGHPCSQPTPVGLNVFVRDAAGNASDTRQAEAGWQYRHHDESQISSSNACEPCGGQVTIEDLPVVVCGRLGLNHGFGDGIDSTQILLAPSSPPITAVANFDNVLGEVSFNYGTEDTDITSIPTTDGVIGLTIQPEPVSTPAANYFYIVSENSVFSEADWTMFIDRRLPPLAP